MTGEQKKLWKSARGNHDQPFKSAQALYIWGTELSSRKAVRELIGLLGIKKVSAAIVRGCVSNAYTYKEARTLYVNMFVMFLIHKNKTLFEALYTLLRYVMPRIPFNARPSQKLLEEQIVLLFEHAIKRAKQEWVTHEMQMFFSSYCHSHAFQIKNFFKKTRTLQECKKFVDVIRADISFDEIWNYVFNTYYERIPLRSDATPFICILVQNDQDEFIRRFRSLYHQGKIGRFEAQAMTIHFGRGEADYGFHIPKSFREAFSRIYQQS